VWPLVRTALIAGGVAAVVGFVPFSACALVSGLLGLSIAWSGLGSVGSAIIVEAVQLGLFALVGSGVAAIVRFVARLSLAREATEEAGSLARAGGLWATVGSFVAMVVSGYLRFSATVPAISMSDSIRMSYAPIAAPCACLGALLGMWAVDHRRRK
jgi:hypothetical protein